MSYNKKMCCMEILYGRNTISQNRIEIYPAIKDPSVVQSIGVQVFNEKKKKDQEKKTFLSHTLLLLQIQRPIKKG